MAFTFDSNNNLNVALVGSTPVVSENLASVGGANITLGAKTSANSLPVVLASDEATLPVSIAGTVAENLTQVGGASVTLGAKTSANSIPVVLASDEANVPVIGAISAFASTTITSATSTGLVLSIPCAGYSTVLVDLRSLNTCTGGMIQFEGVGPGNFNSSVMGMRQIDSSSQQFYDATSTQSLALSNDTRIIYQIPVAGLSTVNVILSPAFTGSGSILLAGRASNGSAPGPTTVGQSDATKLNATVTGAVTTTGAISSAANAVWNSATPVSTTLTVSSAGMSAVKVEFSCDGGTFTQGIIAFRVGGLLYHVTGMRQSKFGEQLYDATSTFTPTPSANYIYWFEVGGLDNFVLVLEQAITGTGNVTISAKATAQPIPGPTTVGQSDASKLNATVVGGISPIVNTVWTSATAGGTHLDLNCAGMGSVVATVATTSGTFSSGRIRFFAESNGGFGYDITGMRMRTFGGTYQQAYDADHILTLLTSDSYSYWFPVSGFSVFRIYLDAAITGSGSVTISLQAASAPIPGPTTVGQSDSSKHRVGAHGNTGSFRALFSGPAAGNNASVTVPAGKKWIVQSIQVIMATNATAANREMFIYVLDGTATQLFQTPVLSGPAATLFQPASLTYTYNFSPATNFYMTGVVHNNIAMPFPALALGPASQILTNVQSLQAGDVVTMNVGMIELPD